MISATLAAALALTPAIGATVTWDTSTTAGFQSGNGTWGTDSFWSSNGTTLSPWISGDTASFLGQTTAVNDTITADGPTAEFLKKWCPKTPHTRPLTGDEAPLSNRKIREVLGFKEEHNWRDEVRVLKPANSVSA